MAFRIKEKFGTNIGVGITGVAGPDQHGGSRQVLFGSVSHLVN